MGRKANQAIIGGFILGAVLLAVAGIVGLDGGRFFRHTRTAVAYFDGSLEGLDTGAPVTFNGVKIGSVTDVRVVIDPKEKSIRTPVFFTIDAGRLRDGGGGHLTRHGLPDLAELIAHGLRARLQLQSLVTGQLAVALNFYPDTPVRLVGHSKHVPEIPTIPSSFERLTRTLENLPLDTLVTEAIRTMHSVEALATAPELKAVVTNANRVLADVDGTVRDVRSRIGPLATTVHDTAAATRTTMEEAQRTMTDMRTALAQLTPPAAATLAEYQALAQDARRLVARADTQLEAVSVSLQAALADAHDVLGEDSPIRYDLANTLQEMTRAARSLRTLADYLDQHPEALLVGKREETAR